MSVVTTDHLSKWYGQVIGLNDVTLAVSPGVTGLLGPNGAGKSTLLKLITGQLKPSKGTVRVLGEPVWGNPGIYRRVGLCPEQDAFYDRMTGLEWLVALLRLQGYDEQDARFILAILVSRGASSSSSTTLDSSSSGNTNTKA